MMDELKTLECGHDDTMSHLIVTMGTALLAMLPVFDRVTLKAWQDVYLVEIANILALHDLTDKPAISAFINDPKTAERISVNMQRGFDKHRAATQKQPQGWMVPGPDETM